jgi:hypothetical protein
MGSSQSTPLPVTTASENKAIFGYSVENLRMEETEGAIVCLGGKNVPNVIRAIILKSGARVFPPYKPGPYFYYNVNGDIVIDIEKASPTKGWADGILIQKDRTENTYMHCWSRYPDSYFLNEDDFLDLLHRISL